MCHQQQRFARTVQRFPAHSLPPLPQLGPEALMDCLLTDLPAQLRTTAGIGLQVCQAEKCLLEAAPTKQWLLLRCAELLVLRQLLAQVIPELLLQLQLPHQLHSCWDWVLLEQLAAAMMQAHLCLAT